MPLGEKKKGQFEIKPFYKAIGILIIILILGTLLYEWADCELEEILRNELINLSGIHNNTNTEKLNNETNKTLQISEIIIYKK